MYPNIPFIAGGLFRKRKTPTPCATSSRRSRSPSSPTSTSTSSALFEAVEAGVHKIRLNPGNINDRKQVIDVIQACKQAGRARSSSPLPIDHCPIPIRIGVNEGSIIERRDKQKRMKELGAVFSTQKHGHLLAIMITKLEEYLDIFYEQDFYDIAISAKSMDAQIVIDAYAEISKRFDHPLHLGVTHAGPKETGTIRSVVALGHLLASGIGDTIRISYANDPIYEVEDGLELLYCLSLKERIGVDLIACPTCGRIQVDLFTLIQDVRKALASKVTVPMKVAVMGCIVNGPGEAEGADVAVFAGDRRGIIYVQGEKVANVPEEEILNRLLSECLNFQDKVRKGEAKLGEKKVEIIPPDPLGALGSGLDKAVSRTTKSPRRPLPSTLNDSTPPHRTARHPREHRHARRHRPRHAQAPTSSRALNAAPTTIRHLITFTHTEDPVVGAQHLPPQRAPTLVQRLPRALALRCCAPTPSSSRRSRGNSAASHPSSIGPRAPPHYVTSLTTTSRCSARLGTPLVPGRRRQNGGPPPWKAQRRRRGLLKELVMRRPRTGRCRSHRTPAAATVIPRNTAPPAQTAQPTSVAASGTCTIAACSPVSMRSATGRSPAVRLCWCRPWRTSGIPQAYLADAL